MGANKKKPAIGGGMNFVSAGAGSSLIDDTAHKSAMDEALTKQYEYGLQMMMGGGGKRAGLGNLSMAHMGADKVSKGFKGKKVTF